MPLAPQHQSSAVIPTVYVESFRGIIESISATGSVRVVVMDYDDPQSFPCKWATDISDPTNAANLEQLILDRDTPPPDRTPEQVARMLKHEDAVECGIFLRIENQLLGN